MRYATMIESNSMAGRILDELLTTPWWLMDEPPDE